MRAADPTGAPTNSPANDSSTIASGGGEKPHCQKDPAQGAVSRERKKRLFPVRTSEKSRESLPSVSI